LISKKKENMFLVKNVTKRFSVYVLFTSEENNKGKQFIEKIKKILSIRNKLNR
jgi:hypothetical protein